MNRTIHPTQIDITTISESVLVRVARGEMALRDFASALNEKIPAGAPGTISAMSVSNWENGVYFVGDHSLWAWREYYGEDELPHRLAVAIIRLRKRTYERGSEKISEGEAKKLLKQVMPAHWVGRDE